MAYAQPPPGQIDKLMTLRGTNWVIKMKVIILLYRNENNQKYT